MTNSVLPSVIYADCPDCYIVVMDVIMLNVMPPREEVRVRHCGSKDIERKYRLLKVSYVPATTTTFLTFFLSFFAASTNSTNQTNKAGGMCH